MTEEFMADLEKYFNKLIKLIEYEYSFKLGNKRLLDKKRTDDILCCIEASLPKEFKLFREKIGTVDKRIRTFRNHKNLMENIKIKPPIGTSSYFINYAETIDAIYNLKKSIPADISYILQNYNLDN